jgi:hypothetical protein
VDSLTASGLADVRQAVPDALLGLALAANAEGDHLTSAVLHGVADQHLERAGRPLDALYAEFRDRDHSQLRAAIGSPAFDAAHRRGFALSQADAIALATAAPSPPDLSKPSDVVR